MEIKYFFHVTYKRISFFITFNGLQQQENSSSGLGYNNVLLWLCVFVCVCGGNKPKQFILLLTIVFSLFLWRIFSLLICILFYCVSLFCLLHVICVNVDPLLYTLTHSLVHTYYTYIHRFRHFCSYMHEHKRITLWARPIIHNNGTQMYTIHTYSHTLSNQTSLQIFQIVLLCTKACEIDTGGDSARCQRWNCRETTESIP